jgi:hypothetical protein
MICVWPVELTIYEETIKAECIGTVSVHSYLRGKGYMKLLMDAAIKDMKKNDCAFAFLRGQRQRYEYYGFEPSGIQIDYTVTKTNIRHCFKNIDISKMVFTSLDDNEQFVEEAFSLYQSQSVKAAREKDKFLLIIKSGASEPNAILYDGNFAGYFSLQDKGTISEFFLPTMLLLPCFLYAQYGKRLSGCCTL